MTRTVSYDVNRAVMISATATEFADALAGKPVIVGHDGSEEPTTTRSLWQQPGVVAVRADVGGRTMIVLLSSDAADTDERAIAFAQAALKSAGVL